MIAEYGIATPSPRVPAHALSERVVVLFNGEVMGIVPSAAAERERIGLMMTGQRL